MRLGRLRKLKRLAPGLLASLLVIALMQIHAWAPLERKIDDQFFRWRGSLPWDDSIVAIKVDDRSLNQLGSFPLSNDYYADLVTILQKENVSVIAFSMLFPSNAVSGGDPESSRQADARFAAAMAEHGRVVIGQGVSIEGEALSPVPTLADSAIATGHLRLRPDSDGITRWVDLTLGDTPIPALGVAAIQAYSLENKLVSIPPDTDWMRLHWPGFTIELKSLSLIDVLNGELSDVDLQDKIAIVGYSPTAGYTQLLRTPFDEQVPVLGDYIHAVVIHDLLQQSWLRAPPKGSIILSLLLGGAALSGSLYQRPAWIKVATTLGLSALWLIICFLSLQRNYLLPFVAPVATIAFVGASVMLLGRLQSSAMLQVRSAFLNTMSHEMRTPLNAIVNLSDMLQDTPLDDRQHEFVDSLHNSSQTLLALINDVLDFSKIESDQLVLEDYPVNLREIVERSLEMLAPRVAEKNIELVYALTPNTPAVILSDPVRLQQVLINLLSNAVKFTESGQISVEVEAAPRLQKETWRSRLIDALQLDALRLGALKQRFIYQVHQLFRRQSKQQIRTGRAMVAPGRLPFDRANSFYEIRFAVKDTGIGIPSDRVGELFKPFSQVSPSTTRKYGGTGLGLAISKRLSERMGGRLWVKSQSGKGSTFYFSIRSHLAHPQPALPEALLQLSGTQLLLIDNSATRRDRLVWDLSPFGIHLAPTRSIAEAMVELQDQPAFDAIILDDAIAATDDGDRRTIEALRQAAGNPQLPIILLSALRNKVPSLSHTTVLWKPIKQSSLYQALQFIFPSQDYSVGDPESLLSTDELALPLATPEILPVPNLLALPGTDPQSKLILPLGQLPSAELRILIAEDNRINQRVALRMLELLGYEADVVTSGKAVLETLKHQTYDVILMDMRMPELNGIETTRRIRQMPQHQAVWIVAMTANAMTQDRERCLNAGMDDYLSKPINREALNRALDRCLAVKESG